MAVTAVDFSDPDLQEAIATADPDKLVRVLPQWASPEEIKAHLDDLAVAGVDIHMVELLLDSASTTDDAGKAESIDSGDYGSVRDLRLEQLERLVHEVWGD